MKLTVPCGTRSLSAERYRSAVRPLLQTKLGESTGHATENWSAACLNESEKLFPD